MDTIRKKVKDYIEKYHLLEDTKKVIVGVSGGPDSMCLLHLLMTLRHEYGYDITVVHINHGIRGKEAQDDMEYVEIFCKEHGIAYEGFFCEVPKLAKNKHISTEEAGREVRYQKFEEVRRKNHAEKIAVAHNRNDNTETFLMNLFRGTGIAGLTGIRPARNSIIRPVLCLDRQEIMEYLRENRIDYRIDDTNEEDVYTRNKIRNRVIPYIQDNINEKAVEHIGQASALLSEIQDYLDRQLEQAWSQVAEKKQDMYELSVDELKKQDITMQKMICRKAVADFSGKLKDISYVHIENMLELTKKDTGRKINLPAQMICERQYGKLRLYHKDWKKSAGQVLIACDMEGREGEKKTFSWSGGKLSAEIIKKEDLNFKIQEKMYTKWMDYDILEDNAFQIRNRKQGDYIIVNQNGGRKKLKDYLIDLKVPREERDHIPLLVIGEEVLWVIGYRISERCKVTGDTKKVIQLEYSES